MKYSSYKALLSEYIAEGGFEAIILPPRKQDNPLWEYPVLPVSSYKIQKQYEVAMHRHSDYTCDLRSHLTRTDYGVKVWCTDHKNAIVGYIIKGIFVASHFAPQTLKGGYRMLQEMADSDTPVVFAVLPFLATMLHKLGFEELCHVPQYFNGQIVDKTVMVNEAFTEEHAQLLIDYYNNE